MKNSNDVVLSLILNLAGIEFSEPSIGLVLIDTSLKKEEIIDELIRTTGNNFDADIKKWISWFKENYAFSDQDEINMQFAIIIQNRKYIQRNNAGL